MVKAMNWKSIGVSQHRSESYQLRRLFVCKGDSLTPPTDREPGITSQEEMRLLSNRTKLSFFTDPVKTNKQTKKTVHASQRLLVFSDKAKITQTIISAMKYKYIINKEK